MTSSEGYGIVDDSPSNFQLVRIGHDMPVELATYEAPEIEQSEPHVFPADKPYTIHRPKNGEPYAIFFGTTEEVRQLNAASKLGRYALPSEPFREA